MSDVGGPIRAPRRSNHSSHGDAGKACMPRRRRAHERAPHACRPLADRRHAARCDGRRRDGTCGRRGSCLDDSGHTADRDHRLAEHAQPALRDRRIRDVHRSIPCSRRRCRAWPTAGSAATAARSPIICAATCTGRTARAVHQRRRRVHATRDDEPGQRHRRAPRRTAAQESPGERALRRERTGLRQRLRPRVHAVHLGARSRRHATLLTREDRATRRAAYAHVERIILDDVPEIVAMWPLDLEAMTVDVRGVRDVDIVARPHQWSI